MIKTFSDKETKNIFDGKHSKKYAAIENIAKRKLDMIHFAFSEKDLVVPLANRF